MAQDAAPAARYALGPGDELRIEVLESPQSTRERIKVDSSGGIQIPLAGRVPAAGRTTQELERALRERLQAYIRDPQVMVELIERRGQQVSVLGAVRDPGLHHLAPNATLLEALSAAGGAAPEAGPHLTITRRARQGPLPLPGARAQGGGEYRVASVDLSALLSGAVPESNIEVLPHDVIAVPRAEMVYVVGAVERSGGFVLGDSESVTVLEALALAGGLARAAAPKNARILRSDGAPGSRTELAVNLTRILKGKSDDVRLRKDDILFVPQSGTKTVATQAAQAALSIGTGVAIWRAGR